MRKAIQTWVAIVLAIIIAIAIAVPIYLWVATLTAPRETKVGKGNMVIEDISWDEANNNVTIVIKNTGSITLVLTDIYIKQGTTTLAHLTWNGSQWEVVSGTFVDGISPNNQNQISVGSSITFVISFASSWDSGYAYTFKVVSSSGAIAEKTEIAP